MYIYVYIYIYMVYIYIYREREREREICVTVFHCSRGSTRLSVLLFQRFHEFIMIADHIMTK